MTGSMHPQVSEVLEQAQQFTSALEEQMHWMDTESFKSTDEEKTVEVSLNGRHWLTGLHIEDGLLRLGAETVGARINQALSNAQKAATEAVEAKREALIEGLGDIVGRLKDITGMDPGGIGPVT
ncbi:MAG: YbaB/EbfC family nucleoid-associated protein [Mycobacteriaceae bacterium]|nr:YbaB/EbfC family nucleoid-associated protein [Mycobacteriaceae bacterium]